MCASASAEVSSELKADQRTFRIGEREVKVDSAVKERQFHRSWHYMHSITASVTQNILDALLPHHETALGSLERSRVFEMRVRSISARQAAIMDVAVATTVAKVCHACKVCSE